MKTLQHQGRRYEPAAEATRCDARVLVIDNYDSFTFNLVQYFLELGAVVDVYRNDALSVADVLADGPSHILLSPGPGRPSDSGVCQDLCRVLCEPESSIPMLGVCLGHQTLCEVHGASVVRARRIMHGKTSHLTHDGAGVFSDLPLPLVATRYHSLIVEEETLPPALIPVAHTQDEDQAPELMAVRHRDRPVYGVQFHPESILSEAGHQLLRNFLNTRTNGGAA